MHIVIGLLTALAGLAWAIVSLQKSGFKLSSLNPFLWIRRSKWNNQYNAKPIYSISDPMDMAALLLLGITKCEGEISAEQKKQLTDIFTNEFHLNSDEAADLLLASSHLLREEIYLVDNLPKILKPSQSNFSPTQIESVLSLMNRVATIEGKINEEQQKLISATQQFFTTNNKQNTTWK